MRDDFLEPDAIGAEPGRWSWIIGLLVAALLFIGINSALYLGIDTVLDLARRVFPVAVETVATSTSPDGQWTVRVESRDAGAAASAGYSVLVRPSSGGRERLLFSAAQRDFLWSVGEPDIAWIDSETIRVGGHVLSLRGQR